MIYEDSKQKQVKIIIRMVFKERFQNKKHGITSQSFVLVNNIKCSEINIHSQVFQYIR